MFLASLTAALTTIKHCQFGHRCPAVINDGNQADGEEPAGSSVERPAETALPAEPAHSPVKGVMKKTANDPTKVTAGLAGAAARQKRLLEQLQAANESLRPPVSAADNECTSAPPKEAKPPKRTDERLEHNHNWIPWIIGACLAGGSLAYVFTGFARGNMRLRASPTSVAAGPRPKSRINLPN